MIHAAVVAQLQPFIVTSWHGHRNDLDIPRVVNEVWREKFDRRNRRGPDRQSNVDLAVLDSKGRLVHWFDGFQYRTAGRRESLAQYTAREIQRAGTWLRLVEAPPKLVKTSTLRLPDLDRSRGVRVFVRLKDDRMPAYQVPVVETVPLGPDDWKPLAWPEDQRLIDASALEKWLFQVYPPGVMERTNPQTKRVYRIRSVTGQLALVSAGASATRRYAVASGAIRLTDEGEDGFSFGGKLELVLTYTIDDPDVVSLRGVFEGIYPRVDRRAQRRLRLPLQAVFESLPD